MNKNDNEESSLRDINQPHIIKNLLTTKQHSKKRRIIDLLSFLDFFKEPLSFTYNNSDTYTTGCGYCCSIVFYIIGLFLLINNIFFFNTSNWCNYTQIYPASKNDISIDLQEEFLIFITTFNSDSNRYINSLHLFDIVIEIKSPQIKGNTKAQQTKFSNKKIIFSLCEYKFEPAFYSELIKKYNLQEASVLCPTSSKMDLSEANLYNSKFVISFRNKLTDFVVYKNSLNYLFLTFYYGHFSYVESDGTFNIDFRDETITLKDYIYNETELINTTDTAIVSSSKSPNIFISLLERSEVVKYSGYFGIKTLEKITYSMTPLLKEGYLYDRSNSNLFSFEFTLPYKTNIIYYQHTSFLFYFGILWGWIFLFFIIFKGISYPFIKYSMLYNINKRLFNLIDGEGKSKLNKLTSTISNRMRNSQEEDGRLTNINSDKYLDLMIKDINKYNQFNQMSWKCCDFLTYILCSWNGFLCSKKTVLKHKTMSKSITQMMNLIDNVNVVQKEYEILHMKELMLDLKQKKLVELYNKPNVVQSKILQIDNETTADIENTFLVNPIQYYELHKENLKDAMVLLRDLDKRSSKQLMLIKGLQTNMFSKEIYFDLRQHKKRYNNKLIAEPIDFDAMFQFLYQCKTTRIDDLINIFSEYSIALNEMGDLETLSNVILLQFTFQKLLPCLKNISEENIIIKDTIIGNKNITNQFDTNIVRERLDKVQLLTVHPLITSSMKEKGVISTDYNEIHAKNKTTLFTTIENAIDQIINSSTHFIYHIFFIYHKQKQIASHAYYSLHYSFDAIQICIKLSFLSCIIYAYYFYETFSHNTKKDFKQCDNTILCIGYLSYAREPDNIQNIFTFTLIFNNVMLFAYILNMFIRFFLKKTDTKHINDKCKYSKSLFEAIDLRIYDQKEMTDSFDTFLSLLNKGNNLNVLTALHILFNILISIAIAIIMVISFGSCSCIVYLFTWMGNGYNYNTKSTICVISLAVIINSATFSIYYLINYYQKIELRLRLFLEFWLLMITKGLSYVIILATNLNIIFGVQGGFVYSYFTLPFFPEEFVCREDEAGFNLILFLSLEFLIRKFSVILYVFITTKPYYHVNKSLVNTLCQFFLLSIIQLVFPIAGMFTVIIFAIEYHLEFLSVKYFFRKPHVSHSDHNYQLYNLFGFICVLLGNIIFGIIFENQYTIMNNFLDLSPAQIMMIPKMCRHQSIEDDLQYFFRSSFDIETYEMYECVELFILLPCALGLIFLMFFSKSLLNAYMNELKTILSANKNYSWVSLTEKTMTIVNKMKKKFNVKCEKTIQDLDDRIGMYNRIIHMEEGERDHKKRISCIIDDHN